MPIFQKRRRSLLAADKGSESGNLPKRRTKAQLNPGKSARVVEMEKLTQKVFRIVQLGTFKGKIPNQSFDPIGRGTLYELELRGENYMFGITTGKSLLLKVKKKWKIINGPEVKEIMESLKKF